MENHNVLLIFTLIGISIGQVTQPGRCPNIPTIQNFNLYQFLGPWFGVEQFPEFKQIDLVCPVTVFNLNINYTIRIEQRDYNTLDEQYQQMYGTATVLNPRDPGKWQVRDSQQQYPYPYWVVDTDYRRFAVTWTCIDLFNGSHLQYLFVLSRSRQGLPQYIRFLINRYLQAFGVDTTLLQSNDQTTCFTAAQNTTGSGATFQRGRPFQR
ncbi:APOD [Mytilus coruscus]|uniref:APOD n=1 Tax=Mytilus coruscus TaxID=42192 RepID=A0A6J8BBR1_MYTCO|nr:APOD [Mytilus coruscus]